MRNYPMHSGMFPLSQISVAASNKALLKMNYTGSYAGQVYPFVGIPYAVVERIVPPVQPIVATAHLLHHQHPSVVMAHVTVEKAAPPVQAIVAVVSPLPPPPIVEMAPATGQRTVATAPKIALEPINATIVQRLNTSGQHGLNVEHPVET